jgi:hypothetical protein
MEEGKEIPLSHHMRNLEKALGGEEHPFPFDLYFGLLLHFCLLLFLFAFGPLQVPNVGYRSPKSPKKVKLRSPKHKNFRGGRLLPPHEKNGAQIRKIGNSNILHEVGRRNEFLFHGGSAGGRANTIDGK